MRRVLTEEEIAEDKKRDAHMQKCMSTLRNANTGKELLDAVSKLKPMQGNIIPSTITRRLPKGYLFQYEWLIRCLLILDHSMEEIRGVIETISGRKINHQLVLTFVHNLPQRSRHTDVNEIFRILESRPTAKDYSNESLAKAVEVVAGDIQQSAPVVNVGIWDDRVTYDLSRKVVLTVGKKGELTTKFEGITRHLKAVVGTRLVSEIEPKLSQDPEGEKLLESLKAEGEYTLRLNHPVTYFLFFMNQKFLRDAKSSKSKAVDEFFEQTRKIPFSVMQWSVLQKRKDVLHVN